MSNRFFRLQKAIEQIRKNFIAKKVTAEQNKEKYLNAIKELHKSTREENSQPDELYFYLLALYEKEILTADKNIHEAQKTIYKKYHQEKTFEYLSNKSNQELEEKDTELNENNLENFLHHHHVFHTKKT
jgi:hypothetical protein